MRSTLLEGIFMLRLYNILAVLVLVFGGGFLLPFLMCSEKRRKTMLRRLGFHGRLKKPTTEKNDSKPIWVHALSVGEVNAAIPLVNGLKEHFPEKGIVFSTTTKSGFENAQRIIESRVSRLLYFPYDLKFSIFKTFRAIDPAVVIIVETDLWPNFLSIMRTKKVPVVLCNARLSPRSYKSYKRLPFAVKMTFDLLTFICPSSTQDAERLADLGIPRDRIHAPGNLKYDIQYEPLTPQEIRKLKTTMGIGEIEKILVAGSTHPGEEEILCKALIQIRQRMIHSRLIIVPRHPDRSFQVMKILDKFGLSGTLFDSQTPSVLPDTIDVWIINRMGTLHKMYEIADVAFVGGSLVKNGGHNPLEPAACSKPILFGPDMSDFKDVSKKLIEVQGAVEVKDENSLAQEVLDLFMNRNISENMGRNAYSVYCSGKGTVIRTLKLLERYL